MYFVEIWAKMWVIQIQNHKTRGKKSHEAWLRIARYHIRAAAVTIDTHSHTQNTHTRHKTICRNGWNYVMLLQTLKIVFFLCKMLFYSIHLFINVGCGVVWYDSCSEQKQRSLLLMLIKMFVTLCQFFKKGHSGNMVPFSRLYSSSYKTHYIPFSC